MISLEKYNLKKNIKPLVEKYEGRSMLFYGVSIHSLSKTELRAVIFELSRKLNLERSKNQEMEKL